MSGNKLSPQDSGTTEKLLTAWRKKTPLVAWETNTNTGIEMLDI